MKKFKISLILAIISGILLSVFQIYFYVDDINIIASNLLMLLITVFMICVFIYNKNRKSFYLRVIQTFYILYIDISVSACLIYKLITNVSIPVILFTIVFSICIVFMTVCTMLDIQNTILKLNKKENTEDEMIDYILFDKPIYTNASAMTNDIRTGKLSQAGVKYVYYYSSNYNYICSVDVNTNKHQYYDSIKSFSDMVLKPDCYYAADLNTACNFCKRYGMKRAYIAVMNVSGNLWDVYEISSNENSDKITLIKCIEYCEETREFTKCKGRSINVFMEG